MTNFFIFTALILIAISVWQITKIFELSQTKKANNQIADDDKTDQCDFIIDNINLEEISNKVLKIHNSILNSI